METEMINACKDLNFKKVAVLLRKGVLCHNLFQHFEDLYDTSWTFWKYTDLKRREKQFKKLVQLLLDNKVDVNMLDTKGKNALHYCCERGWHPDIMDMLIKGGANVNKPAAKSGLYPLHFTLGSVFHSESLLCTKERQKEIKLNHFNTLLDHGAMVNVQNINFDSPLMWAICKIEYVPTGTWIGGCYMKEDKLLNVIDRLIANGCDVNHCNSDGQTALHYIIRGSLPYTDVTHKIFNVLMEKKLNPDVQDKKGNTPLHILCQEVDPSIVYDEYAEKMKTKKNWAEFLLNAGCSVNIRNTDKQLPISSLFSYMKVLKERRSQVIDSVAFLWIHEFLKVLHQFLEAGLNLAILHQQMGAVLNFALLETGKYFVVSKVILCGFKLKIQEGDLKNWSKTEEEDLETLCCNVIPLKYLAATAVRISLVPNALVGVKLLNLPQAIKQLIFVK